MSKIHLHASDNIIKRLEFIIETTFIDFEFELVPYGSSTTDLMTPFSDIDVSIVSHDKTDQNQ